MNRQTCNTVSGVCNILVLFRLTRRLPALCPPHSSPPRCTWDTRCGRPPARSPPPRPGPAQPSLSPAGLECSISDICMKTEPMSIVRILSPFWAFLGWSGRDWRGRTAASSAATSQSEQNKSFCSQVLLLQVLSFDCD